MSRNLELKNALDDFQDALATCVDPVAAAILVHSVRVDELTTRVAHLEHCMKDFDHQICMGIRHGLFGSHADSGVSLMTVPFYGE